jgi:hypothetical protein
MQAVGRAFDGSRFRPLSLAWNGHAWHARTRLVTFVLRSQAGSRATLERSGAQAPPHWFQHAEGVMVPVKQAAAEFLARKRIAGTGRTVG